MKEYNRRRLRLYAAHRGHHGDAEAQGRDIERFLADLRAVICEEFIARLRRDTLGALYDDWRDVEARGVPADERRRLMVQGWPPPLLPFSTALHEQERIMAQVVPDDGKVVTLPGHGRA